MNNREKDARLHELLYGTKCEMRASYRDPEMGYWVEHQSIYERVPDGPIRREMQEAQLAGILREAKERINNGVLHDLQPCAPRILNDDLSSNWQAPFVDWAYEVIPHYTADIAAVHEAAASFALGVD